LAGIKWKKTKASNNNSRKSHSYTPLSFECVINSFLTLNSTKRNNQSINQIINNLITLNTLTV
jgi:hypothetical protein